MDTKETRAKPRIMTVKEISGYFKVHPATIYKMLRNQELPAFKVGSDWRFDSEVIDRWCTECSQN